MMTVNSTRERIDELLSYLNGEKIWPGGEDELILAVLNLGHQIQRLAQEKPEFQPAVQACYSSAQFLKGGARESALVQLGEALSVVNETL